MLPCLVIIGISYFFRVTYNITSILKSRITTHSNANSSHGAHSEGNRRKQATCTVSEYEWVQYNIT